MNRMPDIDTVAQNCTCFRIRRAARQITRAYDAALRPSGLKATQFSLMTALARAGQASITELAETLGMERTTLTRNIRPLEEKGLLKVSPEGYRRTRTLELSAPGRAKLNAALPLWEKAQTQMTQHLGSRGLRELNALLESV
jgi:DNA-binding MarR family transcriptional regulator